MTFGTITRDGASQVVTFERVLPHPRERVWQALTDPGQRALWFFAGTLEPRPGGTVDLTDSAFGITGTVVVFDPPAALEFTWSSKDAPESTVRFELTGVPDGTRLVLTHRVRAGRPENLMPGWHCLLDDLPGFLADGAVAPKPDRFRPLRDHYLGVVTAAVPR